MFRVLTSPRTTTILLLLIAAVLALITVLEAADEGPGVSGETYRLYGSWWLAGLLGLLFVHLTACLVHRRVRRAPALAVLHIGLGLVLAGALLTARGAQRGMVYLGVGEQTNRLQTPGRLWVEIVSDVGVTARTRLRGIDTASPGTTYELPGIGRARLVQFLPASRMRSIIQPRDDEVGIPAIRLDAVTPHGTHEIVLAQGWAEEADVGSAHVVMGTPTDALPGEPALVLRVNDREQRYPLDLPADIGQTLPLGDLAATLLAYASDFKVNQPPRSDGPPRNPALRVAVSAPGTQPETLWVFSSFPGFARPRTPGLTGIEFMMPSASGETLYLHRDDDQWHYRFITADTTTQGVLAQGDTFFVHPTPSARVPLVAAQVLDKGEVIPVVEPAPDTPDAPAAVSMDLMNVAEPIWLIDGGPVVVLPGSDGAPRSLGLTSAVTLPFWIAVDEARREDYPNSSIASLFESTIRASRTPDDVGPPLTVQTNHPARYRGWRIYQAEFGQQEASAWSGFQIARDPGAGCAFAGVLAFTAGLVWHLIGVPRRRVAPILLAAMALTAPAQSHAAPPEIPLSRLIVYEGGRPKPLETMVRDIEIRWGVDFPGPPVAGFLAFALDPGSWHEEPVITLDPTLAAAIGHEGHRRVSVDDVDGARPLLEHLLAGPANAGQDLADNARALLGTADRLASLEELVALAPGNTPDGWWVPPTQDACPPWAVQRWRTLRERYRAGLTADAAREAVDLVSDQRAQLKPSLPSSWRVAAEVWWHRADPLQYLPWWLAAALCAHLALAAGLGRSHRATIAPIAIVTGMQLVLTVLWVAFAGRLPLLNSWEVFFLVLLLVPALGLVVHGTTGMHQVSLVALLLTLAGSVGLRFLPPSGQIVSPPVAILRSSWREIHILSTMISYAFLFLAAGLSIATLISPAAGDGQRVAYRVLRWGTLLLGVGIATGAAWAHEAWGRYWGWDPKEVWALIAWLILAAALHARARGMGGSRGWAALVILGFAALLFTFFGVTFLLPGLHSYG